MRKYFPRAFAAAESFFGPYETDYSEPPPPPPHQQAARPNEDAPAPAGAPAAAITIHDLRGAQAIVTDAPQGDGGRQSLRWEEDSLKLDEDGDEAHGFIYADPPRALADGSGG